MNTVAEIKRLMLRTMLAWGMPAADAQLARHCQDNLTPKPLVSDINQAIRELEADGFIQGNRDDLDKSLVTWALTDKGAHKAKQLG